MNIEIKDEHKKALVGFNNRLCALEDRSNEDLSDLAILAHSRPNLAVYFKSLPSLKDLKNEAGKTFLEKTKDPSVTDPKTT